MIARHLEELGLLSLKEEQTGEGVMIPAHKIFLQGGTCGCEMKNNKKQELKTEAKANSNRKQVCFKTKYGDSV